MLENVGTVSGLPAPELVEGLRELGTGDLVRLWNSVVEPWENLEVFPMEDMEGLFVDGMPLNAFVEDMVRAHDAGRFDPGDGWVYLGPWEEGPVSFRTWSDSRSPIDLVRVALCATLEDLAEVGVVSVSVASR